MWPMSKFSALASRARRHLRRRSDRLVLESCPLHTENAKVAAHAPAQVAAACKRGADVIGFTEVHTALAHELARVCAQHGYGFFHGKGDTAVAYKMTLDAKVVEIDVQGSDRSIVRVSFKFHGSAVAVFATHWPTLHFGSQRAAVTKTLSLAMIAAARGKALAFYLADSNPDKPLSNPSGEPRHSLDASGLPLVYEKTGFPAGIGVTTVGYDKMDTRVTPVRAVTSHALGSDHLPCTVTFKVRRVV